MKKLLRIINNIIFIFLIVSLLFVLYSKYIQKNSVIKLCGYSILIVCTNSMEPEICKNDAIIIKEKDEYNLNDIVTYKKSNNVFITHRIIDFNNAGVVTKGDSNNSADGTIDIKDIQGKVIFHSNLLGIFVVFIRFILLIYIAFILIILIKNIIKEGRIKSETKEV